MGVCYAFLTKDWSSCFWEVSVFTKDVGNIGQKLKEEMHVTHIIDKGTLQVPTYGTILYLTRNLHLS